MRSARVRPGLALDHADDVNIFPAAQQLEQPHQLPRHVLNLRRQTSQFQGSKRNST